MSQEVVNPREDEEGVIESCFWFLFRLAFVALMFGRSTCGALVNPRALGPGASFTLGVPVIANSSLLLGLLVCGAEGR